MKSIDAGTPPSMPNPVFELRRSIKRLVYRLPGMRGLVCRLRGVEGVDLPELDRRIEAAVAGVSAENSRELASFAQRIAGLQRSVFLRVPRDRAMPTDPFSPEYAACQRALFTAIAQRPYSMENEAPPYEQEKAGDDFYPYNTNSCDIVGRELLSYGFVIRNMELKPGSRIVEFGPGLGNITLQLAMMGHHVTGVESSAASASMIRHRAARHNRNIDVVVDDMVEYVERTDDRFDAVLFLASFHHCHDHLRLLAGLSRIVKEGGTIYFAMEHILDAQSPALPYPWGLLLDGGSLYYVRKHGSLEQGFEAAYFRQALIRFGWGLVRIPSGIRGIEDLYVARKRTRNPAGLDGPEIRWKSGIFRMR